MHRSLEWGYFPANNFAVHRLQNQPPPLRVDTAVDSSLPSSSASCENGHRGKWPERWKHWKVWEGEIKGCSVPPVRHRLARDRSCSSCYHRCRMCATPTARQPPYRLPQARTCRTPGRRRCTCATGQGHKSPRALMLPMSSKYQWHRGQAYASWSRNVGRRRNALFYNLGIRVVRTLAPHPARRGGVSIARRKAASEMQARVSPAAITIHRTAGCIHPAASLLQGMIHGQCMET